MKVGITYDLREEYLCEGFSLEETAEFDKPDTIDSIEEALQLLGHETERIGHVRSLVARLAGGSRWDLVFNIAEGLSGFGREAQVPAVLDAYGIPYTFSDPLVLSLTLHKGMTKRVVRDLGIPTPGFAVVTALAWWFLGPEPRLAYAFFFWFCKLSSTSWLRVCFSKI